MDFEEELSIKSRGIGGFLFFFALIGGISLFAAVTLIKSIILKSPHIVMTVLFSFFSLIWLYMAITALLAILWIFWGKERISVNANTILVEKILFFRFSIKRYDTVKISGLYVDSNDWTKNKISKGRNDFLAVFRFGTIHFTYQNRLIHIGGGLSNDGARVFLDKLKEKGLIEWTV